MYAEWMDGEASRVDSKPLLCHGSPWHSRVWTASPNNIFNSMKEMHEITKQNQLY